MSRTGTTAEEAVVQLSQTMVSMLNPSAQAGKVLDAVGLSMADLRKQARDEGLLPALQAIKTTLQGTDPSVVRNLIQNAGAGAAELFEAVGLTMEEVERLKKTEGIEGAVKAVTAALQADDAALSVVFGNVRALRGVLDLLGPNMGDHGGDHARHDRLHGLPRDGLG